MTQYRYRLGTLLGFPIEVNLSFLLLLAFVGIWHGGLAGIAVILLAFASVVLHELGHAVVARRLGVPVPGIELHFFGGAAKMGAQPKSSGDEVAIAAAGPAVSFALAGVATLMNSVFPTTVFGLLVAINLVIGTFNLLPALPMDGGRILRALLSRKQGFQRATENSIKISKVFAVLLGLTGVILGHFYLALLAVMLWWIGNQELLASRLHGGYRKQPEWEVVRPLDRHTPWNAPEGRGFRFRRDGDRIFFERF